ncbi:MAG: S41 family peptidase [Candidatus Shapirobacteria bacterium]|jgi:carboxyl-terminal processing protease
MRIKTLRNITLILAVISVFSLISFYAGRKSVEDAPGSSGREPLDLTMMWRVKDRLQQLYLDKEKIDDKNMVYGAISGMVSSLDDPYTVYLPPSENKSANEDLAGEFGGVGIQLGYKDKTISVMSPLPKTPAEKAGVRAGDLILKITDKEKNIDKDTAGMALDEAVNLIRGKIGTEVTLKLFREGEKETFDVVLKRDNIVVASLELEWRQEGNKKVAWIKLYKFTEQLYTDWPGLVNKINEEKAKGSVAGIVLDLRNNPGGYLQASVLVASDFVESGVIVKQESSDGKVESYEVDRSRRKLLSDNLVVLVNGGSASASEILAGALRDYGRGTLVGEKTFGKGTVQQPEDFSDGSGLHVTVAKWLLPSGKNIHKDGIMPDVEVKYSSVDEEDMQLKKAIEVLTKK